jgi:hypothetical protein
MFADVRLVISNVEHNRGVPFVVSLGPAAVTGCLADACFLCDEVAVLRDMIKGTLQYGVG